jgi:amidase
LLEYFIERTERLNPSLNAIVSTNFVQARKDALAADEALANGTVLGPLHGVPMTIKDNIQVMGMPTTYGSTDFAENMPDEHAPLVQALLDAGAIIFGKTNLPLFGGDTQSINEVFGQTNNPWDLSRTPGGSSGGSAAALAAGLSCLEVGNDIGGSIRLPSHFCGIYGHKPSYNLVPTQGTGSPSRSSLPPQIDLLVNGPMARSAHDLKISMQVIASPPTYQKQSIRYELPPARESSLKDFRVGVWGDDSIYPVDDDTAGLFSGFITRLKSENLNLVAEKPPSMDLHRNNVLRRKFYSSTLAQFEPKASWEQALQARDDDDLAVREWARDMTITHREWLLLDKERASIRQEWQEYFRDVDVLLCPVCRVPAHPHDKTPMTEQRYLEFNNEKLDYWDVVLPWNAMALVSYLPSTVVPIGFTQGGLPVGLQIIGPYLEDLTPIEFAIGLEEELLGPYELPPGFE